MREDGGMSCDKPDSTAATNIERLRGHLGGETLAAKLVDTYRANAPEERAAALKGIAEARLAEIRAELEKGKPSNAAD